MTIREHGPAPITETISVAGTTKIRTGLRFASEHADDDYLTWRVESRQASGDYALDSRFKIARTGQLIVKAGSHFDFKSDDNPNGVLNLRVIEDDGSAGSDSGPVSQDIVIQILDLDDAPMSMSFVDGINSALISENPTTARKLADIIFEDDGVGRNRADLPGAFSDWITSLDQHPMLILVMILLSFAVLGMFMDAIGMLLLTLHVVYPAVMALNGGEYVSAADSTFGMSGQMCAIWFGILVVKMAELCLITPPIGLNCFVVAGVRDDLTVHDVFRGVTPFFIADALTIIILVMYPSIVLWLPSQVG